jgi:tetrachlorobenzoquinone reductase
VDDLISVRVAEIRSLTERIIAVEFRPSDGHELPSVTAGAHVDLHLPNGLVRSYSLLNSHEVRGRYLVAVSRDENSRGGSQYLHDDLQSGDMLAISPPRNNFPLFEESQLSVFVAGGIGITPILAMVRRVQSLGRDWRLYYCARSRPEAAFLDELHDLSGGRADRLHLHFDDEHDGKPFDVGLAVAQVTVSAHVYCCGPLPMLDSFAKAAANIDAARVHVEHFTAAEPAATDGGFTVELAQSGVTLSVDAGNTILDTLLEAGLDVPFSCGEGICGSCETGVLSGTPDHRDLVLSDAERSSNQTMMICCSGSLGPRLVLDR